MGVSSGLTPAWRGAQCSPSMLKERHDHTPRISCPPEPAPALTRRAFLARTATSVLTLSCPPTAVRAAETAVAGDERDLMEPAIPARAFAPSRKPRKLLIFDRNVNYGGDGSNPTTKPAVLVLGGESRG